MYVGRIAFVFMHKNALKYADFTLEVLIHGKLNND